MPERLYEECRGLCLRVFYFGLKRSCPMCGSRLRKMLPGGTDLPAFEELKIVGFGYRRHRKCPVCLSTDRERNVYLFLTRMTAVFTDNLSILHIAPEKNLQERLVRSGRSEYISADIDPYGTAMKMDVRDIPFEDGRFDVFICNHVLEHVTEDRLAMSELSRVTRPGGWGIMQVPISLALDATLEDMEITTPQGSKSLFGQEDHVRIYAKDYVHRLEQAGLSVREYHMWEYLEPEEVRRFCLVPDESIFFCRVPRHEDPGSRGEGPADEGGRAKGAS